MKNTLIVIGFLLLFVPAKSATTTLSVYPDIKYQTMEGWGGSLCWWANIMGGYSDTKIKTICDWITDPVSGLNMNIFRFNIGGGDDPTHNHMRGDGGAMPGYKASLTATYDWTQDANQRKILQQLIASRIAKAGVNDIQIVGFSNSPPYWMTRSGCSAGSVEGNVTNLKSDMFDDFADYLTEVTRYYHDSLGITFNYLEPFNEPDGGWWKALGNQEGCFFSNADQIKMIRELYTSLTNKNMLGYCRITANDANNIDNGYNAMLYYQNAGDIVPKIDLISVHTYGGSRRADIYNWARSKAKKLWQSESGPIGVGGTNEFQMMTMSDRIITDLRDMKCSAWVDWQLAADASPTWGLIVGEYSNVLQPVSRAMSFYIRAQYSRYLKAGYKLVYCNATNAVAAMSPDDKELVVVISNITSSIQSYSVDLTRFTGFGRVKQVRTRAQESLGVKNSETFFNMTGQTIEYNAQPESVTTFVIPVNQPTVGFDLPESDKNMLYYANGSLVFHQAMDSDFELKIFTPDGRFKTGKTYKSGVSKITIDLPSGIYIAKIEHNSKILTSKIYISD